MFRKVPGNPDHLKFILAFKTPQDAVEAQQVICRELPARMLPAASPEGELVLAGIFPGLSSDTLALVVSVDEQTPVWEMLAGWGVDISYAQLPGPELLSGGERAQCGMPFDLEIPRPSVHPRSWTS